MKRLAVAALLLLCTALTLLLANRVLPSSASQLLAPPLQLASQLAPAPTAPQETAGVELVGQVGGSIAAVAVQGSYAYLGIGPRLTVLDVTNRAAPGMVWQSEALTGTIRGIALGDGYAYITAGFAGLRVFDLSNPTQPAEVGHHVPPYSLTEVVIAGDYAYITVPAHWSGDVFLGSTVSMVNVSAPTSPIETGSLPDSVEAYGVAAASSIVYVAAGTYGLQIVDTSNPISPTQVGRHDTPGSASDIVVAGSYAYVADFDRGLRILDLTNPISPTEIGAYQPSSWYYANGVQVSGHYAYLTLQTVEPGALEIIDIADPAHPAPVAVYRAPSKWTIGRAIADGYAFVTDGGGLRIVDVRDPRSPIEVGFARSSAIYGWAVALSGNFAYIADREYGVGVLDVSNPARPTGVARFRTPYVASGVAVSDTYAYVVDSPVSVWNGWTTGGLFIFDVTNPVSPTQRGFAPITTQGPVNGVTVAGNYAYVAGGVDGLLVFDVTNPYSPTALAAWDTPGTALGVTVAGSYAYIADGTGGLEIADITNPASPRVVGAYDIQGTVQAVSIAGNYAYLTDAAAGLLVVDIADPASPAGRGALDLPEAACGITVVDHYAYVADNFHGLRIIDVADPNHLREVGYGDVAERAMSVVVAGDYAYVGVNSGGGPSGGLHVVSVAGRSNLSATGSFNVLGGALAVATTDRYAYVGGGVNTYVIDVANPMNPAPLGNHPRSPSVEVADIATVGNFAYVLASSLSILDVSNPLSPTQVATVATGDESMSVVGGYAYVSFHGGMEVIDVSNPVSPSIVGRLNTGSWGDDIAVAGSYAYIADGPGGLSVVDVGNPAAPRKVGAAYGSYARAVAISGNYAYVGYGGGSIPDGLHIFDISQPMTPTLVGFWPGYIYDVAVAGQRAYLLDGGSVHVIDVSNPSNPVEMADYRVLGSAYKIAVSHGYIYVADSGAGLLILRYAPYRASLPAVERH